MWRHGEARVIWRRPHRISSPRRGGSGHTRPMQCALGPQDSPHRTGRRSVWPFLHASFVRQTDWLTHHATGSSLAIVRFLCIVDEP